MTRGLKVGIELIVLLLTIPLVVQFWPTPDHSTAHVPSRHSKSLRTTSLRVADQATPWTRNWLQHAIPPLLHRAGGVPWIVSDPQHPTRTWWFWPKVVQGALWMGMSEQKGITWHPLGMGQTVGTSWPTPMRQTLQWVKSLDAGRGAIPPMRIEPTGAFRADMGTVTGMTGWEASMEPMPSTIVITWGLQQRQAKGLRFVTLWHWTSTTGWQCTEAILQPEPTAQLPARSQTASIPHPLPGWVDSTPP